MKCLGQNLEEVLTALKFPLVHRARIRTTNLLERLFGRADGAPSTCAGHADRRMKPYLEQRLRQMAKDAESTWEDPDLARLAA